MSKKKAGREIGTIIREITSEGYHSLVYLIQYNLRYFASLIGITLPYAMYILGQVLAVERGMFAVGGELFIPLVVTILTHYLREIANKTNKGNRIPIPRKRFTEIDDDGEVSIRNDRLQELLLYIADLEDWMERKGWL